MGAKSSLNIASFQNSEFCENYTVMDVESSNHNVIPPLESIHDDDDEDDQMPPLEPIHDDDDDDQMPPLEPIHDDDDDDDDDQMPPLEPIQDDDQMSRIESIYNRYLHFTNQKEAFSPPCQNRLEAPCQSPPQAKLASDLVVRCVPHLAQTRPATTSPTELVVKRLSAPCQNIESISSPVVFTNDTIVNTVIESFISRSNLGFKKYNKTLDREDLSTVDWVNHAQEELMDAILYLERLKKNLQK
jgi:hypothetical protein